MELIKNSLWPASLKSLNGLELKAKKSELFATFGFEEEHLREEEEDRTEAGRKDRSIPCTPKHQEQGNDDSPESVELDIHVIGDENEVASSPAIHPTTSITKAPLPVLTLQGSGYREVILIPSDEESEVDQDEVFLGDDDLLSRRKRHCSGQGVLSGMKRGNTSGGDEAESEVSYEDYESEQSDSESDDNERESDNSDGDESNIEDHDSDSDVDNEQLVNGGVFQEEPVNGSCRTSGDDNEENLEQLVPELDNRENDDEIINHEQDEGEDLSPASTNIIHVETESEISDMDSEEDSDVFEDEILDEDSGEETERVEFYSDDDNYGAIAIPEQRVSYVRDMGVIPQEEIEVITISDSEEEEQGFLSP